MKTTSAITYALLLILASQAQADDHKIEFVGKPTVHRVLQQTPTFLGGDVEIVSKVRVTNANGGVVIGARIILYARSKDGPAARLRAYGITRPDGIATPRAIFDLPALSLHVTLQACLAEPADECSPITEVDLTKRTDIEVHYEHLEAATFGTAYYTVNGKPQNNGVVESASVDQFRPRLVFSAWEGVRGSRYSGLTLFGEAAFTFTRLDGFVPSNGATSINFGKVSVGASAQILSRVEMESSLTPTLGGVPAYGQVMASFMQPLGTRNRLIIGAFAFRPLSVSSTIAHQPSLFAPRAAFTRTFRAQEQRLTGWVEYQSRGAALFKTSTETLAREAPSRAPAIGFDWDFHHGGPVFLSFRVYAVGVGTSLPYLGASMGVTLRNFVPRLP